MYIYVVALLDKKTGERITLYMKHFNSFQKALDMLGKGVGYHISQGYNCSYTDKICFTRITYICENELIEPKYVLLGIVFKNVCP